MFFSNASSDHIDTTNRHSCHPSSYDGSFGFCMCIYVFTWVCIHVLWGCECGDQESVSGIFLNYSSPSIFRQSVTKFAGRSQGIWGRECLLNQRVTQEDWDLSLWTQAMEFLPPHSLQKASHHPKDQPWCSRHSLTIDCNFSGCGISDITCRIRSSADISSSMI